MCIWLADVREQIKMERIEWMKIENDENLWEWKLFLIWKFVRALYFEWVRAVRAISGLSGIWKMYSIKWRIPIGIYELSCSMIFNVWCVRLLTQTFIEVFMPVCSVHLVNKADFIAQCNSIYFWQSKSTIFPF